MTAKRLFENWCYAHRRFLLWACWFLASGIVLAGIPSHAIAQEGKDYVLEETTITSTKVGETKLQETPMTVSAFSAENLESRELFNTADIGIFVPNVNFVDYGGFTQGFIRGVGNTSTGAGVGGETNIGYYLDGVYLERGLGANADLYDVERVEILRGPQGVLYGRNSTAGAVNIITRRPTDVLEMKGSAELANYNKYRFDGTISGPISEGKVKGRLAFSDISRDGYLENTLGPDTNDENNRRIRGVMELTPTNETNILLQGDYGKYRTNGYGNKLLANPLPGSGGTIYDDPWKLALNYPQFDNANWWGASGTVKINLTNNMVLRSITAYRKWDRNFQVDIDNDESGNDWMNFVDQVEQFSEELQMDGTWGRLKWLLGFYYYDMKNVWGGPLTLNFVFPGLGRTATLDQKDEAWAGYGNLTYAITDRLSVSAGLRYTDEKKEGTLYASWTGVPRPNSADYLEDSWSKLSPRFGIDYQLTNDAFLYGSISEGFRAGGLAHQNPPPSPQYVDPENLWAYEVGIKTEWLNKRLRANLATFYYDYQDLQRSTVSPWGTPIMSNAAEARTYGFELELSARPIQALTLYGTVGYLNAEYKEYMAPDPATGLPVDVSGNVMPFSPDWRLTLGAQYVIPLQTYGYLTLNADLSWTDSVQFDDFENSLLAQDAYTVANASIRWESVDGHWAVTAYGKNLLQTEYYRYKEAMIAPFNIEGQPGDPLTFGLIVAYKF